MFGYLWPGVKTDEPFDDISDRARKHLQPFWHLESNHGRIIFAYMVDSFVYLERVVGRKLLYGRVEKRIGDDFLGNLVGNDGMYTGLRRLGAFGADEALFGLVLLLLDFGFSHGGNWKRVSTEPSQITADWCHPHNEI